MNAYASARYSLAVPMPEIDTLAKFRDVSEPHRKLPLVFIYGGRAIAPGYHVTEVKAARLSSLDCGANPESWDETVIQLWDIEAANATHMPVDKFLNILTQVEKRVAIDSNGLLIFEAGDSTSPMQIFTVGAIDVLADRVEVRLAPRPATCKPRTRGLDDAEPKASACCGPAKTKSACCGA